MSWPSSLTNEPFTSDDKHVVIGQKHKYIQPFTPDSLLRRAYIADTLDAYSVRCERFLWTILFDGRYGIATLLVGSSLSRHEGRRSLLAAMVAVAVADAHARANDTATSPAGVDERAYTVYIPHKSILYDPFKSINFLLF